MAEGLSQPRRWKLLREEVVSDERLVTMLDGPALRPSEIVDVVEDDGSLVPRAELELVQEGYRTTLDQMVTTKRVLRKQNEKLDQALDLLAEIPPGVRTDEIRTFLEAHGYQVDVGKRAVGSVQREREDR